MHISRRQLLGSAATLAALHFLREPAPAQVSAHPPNDDKLPPVPPDEPVEGPLFLKCGPMLGHVAHDRALVWVKASNAAKLTLRLSSKPDLADARVVQGPALTAETAFAGTLEIPELQPGTRYFYAVLLDGEPATLRPHPSFVTAPAPGAAGKLRLAFVSCVGYRGYMAAASWGEMASRANFDVLLQLGDNHYANTSNLAKQRANYAMHRSVHGFRELTAAVPCYGVWDDHDFGKNDSDETQPGKEDSLRAFKEFWANPAYGEEGNPGCYHKFSRGDVDFFMLDVRYHRSPDNAEKNEHKTMLGEKQFEWLKREIKASKAKLKFIASGSVFDSKGSTDAWAMYPHARKALLDFLREEGGDGVILLSGDRHFTAAYQVEGRFIEVTSGPLGSGNATATITDELWLACSVGKMWSIFEVDTMATFRKWPMNCGSPAPASWSAANSLGTKSMAARKSRRRPRCRACPR
jgi:alkaline phosphatase D